MGRQGVGGGGTMLVEPSSRSRQGVVRIRKLYWNAQVYPGHCYNFHVREAAAPRPAPRRIGPPPRRPCRTAASVVVRCLCEWR